MLLSRSMPLGTVNLSWINDKISMVPFSLSTLEGLPEKYINLVGKILSQLPEKYHKHLFGEAYLTVHTKEIKANNTHRRGGPHIDGNYIKGLSDWLGGGGNGWKVDQHGPQLSTEHHRLSYATTTGGMLIVTDYAACKGWNGIFQDKAGIGGDCSHIKDLQLKEEFMLLPNKVYYGTSQFIHESIPVKEDVKRTMVRITLPIETPYFLI